SAVGPRPGRRHIPARLVGGGAGSGAAAPAPHRASGGEVVTGKQRKSEVRVDDEWVDVADPAEAPVSLDGRSAEAALLMLRALRKAGDTVVITATLTEPKDTVVVDGHAFGGQRTGAGWAFD